MEIFKADISYLVFNFLKENLHHSISLLKINEILQNESGVVDFFETEVEIQVLYKELLSIEMNIVAESNRIEYGDFQTNTILANNITQKLFRNVVFPNLVIEPTCGKGHFIIASLNNLETITTIIGIEIYKPYVWQTKFNILDFFSHKYK